MLLPYKSPGSGRKKITNLGGISGEVKYNVTSETPRMCIIIQKRVIMGNPPIIRLLGWLIKIRGNNGDLNCRKSNEETETARHALYDWEALDHRRHALYGQPKVSLEEYN